MGEKWTPGPWVAEGESAGGFAIAATGCIICQRANWSHRAEESAANGRLISSAPDLYTALSEITALLQMALLSTTAEIARDTQPFIARARAALAKARGEPSATDESST